MFVIQVTCGQEVRGVTLCCGDSVIIEPRQQYSASATVCYQSHDALKFGVYALLSPAHRLTTIGAVKALVIQC